MKDLTAAERSRQFALLREHLSQKVELTGEEFARCRTFFTPRQIRRHQFLLQEGDVCKALAFVVRGCLRAYSVDRKGEEHILQFAVATWWISDLHSYLSGLPATYAIDALEDSELLMLERGARDRMFEVVPKMERFFRLLMEANYVATHRRLNDALSASAEERYLTFLKTYRSIADLVPQHQIASYLGITPQSLSRIRRNLGGR